jgi:D-xylose transport system substrate-binding protein
MHQVKYSERSTIIICVLIMFSTVFFSCKSGNGSTIKIGILFPNKTSNRYFKEQQYFTDKIGELKGECLFAFGDNNDQLQIQQAHELIEKGAQVLIVNSVNQNTAAAIVREAHDNNIPVIAYDRIISNCDLDCIITFDNEKVGQLMASYMLKVKPEGNYVLLGGDKTDRNAVYVKNGIMKELQPQIASGKIKIVYDVFIEEWSKDNAYMNTLKYLQCSVIQPDVIISSFDGMSAGAIKALAEYNLDGTVLLSGQDAELEACRNIVKGKQSMTVYKPVKTLAYQSAEMAVNLAKGKSLPKTSLSVNNGFRDVPAYYIDPIGVDINNIKSTIISDGYQKEEDIYAQ